MAGALAVGTAVRALPAGQAMGTLHIGARHAGVEAEVAEVCGLRDSYQQRTIVTSIGYLMPDQRWVDLSPAMSMGPL